MSAPPPTDLTSILMGATKRSENEPEYSTFQPPAGGDQGLQSSDGHEFRVHSILLTLSSSTFRKMFDSEDLRGRTIKLDEDKETLSLVLESIYPGKPPVVNALPLIQKGLAAAQVYNLDGLTYILDQQLRNSMKEDPKAFDPLAVWNTAKSFSLTETQKLAAELITVDRHGSRLFAGLSTHPTSGVPRCTRKRFDKRFICVPPTTYAIRAQ